MSKSKKSAEVVLDPQNQDSPAFANLRQKIEGNLTKSEAKSTKNESRGKKRERNGQAKDEKDTKPPVKKAKTESRSEERKDVSEDEVDLKSIIAELGGTEEDLDLIKDANSDSEEEGIDTVPQDNEKKGKTLQSGMANILKEIAMVKDTYQDDDEKVNISEPTKSKADEPSKEIVESIPAKSKKSKGLKVEPKSDWHNNNLPNLQGSHTPQLRSIEQLHAYGKSLLEAENHAFKSHSSSSSSQAFYNTVISSGTLSDKISALTLAVQESPLHNMRAFEGLLGLAKKRSRSQAVDVLRALKDLFAQGSMLPDRKLCTFATQPGLNIVQKWQEGDKLPSSLTEEHLIVWTFEDWLKEQYFEILKILETWCNDEIEFAKTRATSYVYELLKEKPEQEANLLRLLINKLGDPVKKIASQASYLIMQLLSHHPAMKEVVLTTLDTDFIFKPSQTMHGRYYAAVTLNQTALSQKEEKIALKLLDIYFGIFKLMLKTPEKSNEQDDELREKLTSAVLTGVNRAYPYSGTEHQAFEGHIDTLFQITHSANFNTSIQAMMLIQQLVTTTSAASPVDRFYRTLYESLLDPRLASSSKQQLYLNLLHRALKADLNQKRVKAFVKRLIQIMAIQDPSFICGTFFLIQDLSKIFPSLATMLDQPEDHDDDIEYNPSKRDPAFSNAEAACLWDILPSIAHYHPSVSTSAEHILLRKQLPGKPDLTLHTLIHFLDRFVYKSKVSSKMHGSSIMQPVASETKVLLGSAGGRQLAVNSAEFLAKNEVPVADAFFHQYFKTIGKTPKKKEKMEEADSDDEDEIWNAMVKSGQDLEGLDEEMDVSDMEGLEDETESDGDEELVDDEESEVDIEAGIFDDSEDAVSDAEEASEFEKEEETAPSKKTIQKREDRERKKKLKALPTFASMEDYMQLLEDNEGEDMG